MTRRRATVMAAVLLATAGVLAACSNTPDDTAAPQPSASSGAAAVSAAGLPIEHIHNVALDGEAVLMGTHEGVYRQAPGAAPVLVGQEFDVMGFTLDGQRWLASGHPGPGFDGPAHLGLIESTDQGASWTSVSLSGKADFHRLVASQNTVLGVNSGDALLWRSADAGKAWKTHGAGPYDIALNPLDPDNALGTTAQGPVTSTDGGVTWKPPVEGAPVVALLAWIEQGVVAVDQDGKVHYSEDAGKTWTARGEVGGAPAALAATGSRVAVLAGDTLWESRDGGATFTARITGLGGGH